MTSRRREMTWNLLGQVANVVGRSVYFLLLARTFGPSDYGVLIGVIAIFGILSPFSSLGTPQIMVREVSRGQTSVEVCLGRMLWLNFVAALALCLVLGCAGGWLFPAELGLAIVLATGFSELFFIKVAEGFSLAFNAVGNMKMAALVNHMPFAFRVGAVIVFLWWAESPTPALYLNFYVAAGLLAALLAYGLVRLHFPAPTIEWSSFAVIRSDGFDFSMTQACQQVNNDADKAMLLRLATADAAGLYGAAYRIVQVCLTPLLALNRTMYRRYFKAGAEGVAGALKLTLKLVPAALAYAGGTAALLWLVAPVIPILLGPKFADTIPVVHLLCLLPALKIAQELAGSVLTGADLQRGRGKAMLLTAILNVGLNAYLIPLYSWKGAVGATLACETFLAAYLAVAVWVRYRSEAA